MTAVTLPDWLQKLRSEHVVNPVRNDSRSPGDTLYGMSARDAFQVIGQGQADFDARSGDLRPDDRALLYAYLNQLGHLEELLAAFGQLFSGKSRPPDPIVVDIGCGPGTGGLALAETLGPEPRFEYIGIDRAASMQRLGARLLDSDHVPGRITAHWAAELGAVEWPHHRSFREVIVIVSYLFASPTLDVVAMWGELEHLLDCLGHGAVMLLYTNSVQERPNRQFPAFRKLLKEAEFKVHADDSGEITVHRWDGPRKRELLYALFRRPRRRRLKLGD